MASHSNMQLRPYQQECIATIAQKGYGRWLCQLATGMGKTVIFAHLPFIGRELILSHRQELVQQPIKYYNCPISIEMGQARAEDTPVVSASIQTMSRRMYDFSPDYFDLIIVDEAHHAASKTYRDVLNYFQPKTLVGFTATPNRADGLGLECIFDEIIYKKDLRYGIENGYLSPIQCRKVNIGFDLSRVVVRMGDYAPGDLERALNVDSCNHAIAEVVATQSELPALIFAVDVAHANAIASAINSRMGEGTAVALSAKSMTREEIVSAYKDGKQKVLVNCALFTEGTDLPNTRTVIVARPTRSAGLYTQMVGRGTRLFPGKDHCLLIDCVGVSDMPLCTAPTLLGLDIDSVPKRYKAEIEGDLLQDIPAIIEQKADVPESWVNNYKQVDIWAKAQGYNLHDVNYVKHADGSLMLRLPASKEHRQASITLSCPDLTGMVTMRTSGGYSTTRPAQDAYDLAFDCLRRKFADTKTLWSLSAARRWGREAATENQIKFIERLARRKNVDVSQVLETLTKLQANNLIERLK